MRRAQDKTKAASAIADAASFGLKSRDLRFARFTAR
jgi:hypothetical protein